MCNLTKTSMSTAPFFILTMTFSSILCFMVNSWIMIWLMLETNTLAFCSLMKTFSKNKKKMAESSMKYFIIQSISSGLLVFSSLSLKSHPNLIWMFIIMSSVSLMIKTGATPFHQWFINIVKKVLWKNNTILMTWQKLAPVYLMIYQLKKVILPFAIMSCIMGALMQMNKKNVMEIMGFSSVFNLSWMMLALMMNLWLLMMFCLIYWMAVLSVMFMIKEMKIKEMNSEKSNNIKKWMVLTIMINLGGIPPMAGFISKWLVFTEMMKHSMIPLVISILILSSINLYIYLRLISHFVMKNSIMNPKTSQKPKKFFDYTIMLANMLPLAFSSL